ncbi:MAG: ABC transporter substrate-binding protein [Chloroflexi bacterium]|nr:ABC transporter substrate-binding protein [Chloroflexota bacterium]
MTRGSNVKVFLASLVVLGLLAASCAPAAEAPKAQDQPAQVSGTAPFPTKGNPKYGGVLTTAQTDDPPNFDLYSNSTTNMQKFTWAAYNNLVLFDPYDNSKFMPDIAERWEISKDGKEATFYLHKNIKFHNGTPLTAADVKFSLEWVKDPPKGVVSTRRDNLLPIDAILTPDEYTVKLVTKLPYAALFPMLAQGWMGIYSKGFVEPKGHKIMEKEMMGSGAFKLKEYIRGTSIEMVKNTDYWQKGVPYLDGLKVFFIPDRGTRLAALRTGQLDMLGLDVLDAEDIAKTMAGKINIEEGVSIGWSTLNMNAKRGALGDLRVRKALSLAIDRPGYIKLVQKGDGVIGGYVPPTSPFALSKEELMKLPGYGPDIEANRREAKKLLAEAGVPNGFDVANFIVRKGSEDLGVYVQDQLKQVGVTSTIKIMDSGPAYDAAVKLDFDMLPWGHGLALDDPDAHYSELYLCGAPRDYSGMCDQKVTELFNKQSQELDPAKRKQLVWDLERYAVPLGIKLVLSWNGFRSASWNYVKGWQETGGGGGGGYNVRHYKQVWMDK